MTLLVLTVLVLGILFVVATALWSASLALRSLGPLRRRSWPLRIGRGVYVALVGFIAAIAACRGLSVVFPGPATEMALDEALLVVAGILQIGFAIRPTDHRTFDAIDRLPSLALGAVSIVAPEFLASGWIVIGAITLHWTARLVAAYRSSATVRLALFAGLVSTYGGLATSSMLAVASGT